MADYEKQFDRVKRFLKRIESQNSSQTEYDDDMWSFFQNCWHLKDWIKNDGSVGVAADKVEEFISNNEELRLCADICNGTKHLRLASSRSGEDPRFGQRKFKVHVGGLPTTISAKYTIDTSGGPVDAFNLATKCLQAWENFIRSSISNEAII